MRRLSILSFIFLCLGPLSYAQADPDDWPDMPSPPSFELYGLASGMRTVDASNTIVITNPGPNQPLGFTPNGFASGARTGFVWRQYNVGLVADIGFHGYSDRTGSTTMAPLMGGLRFYSEEHFKTAFFGEFLGGAYRWTMHTPTVNFNHIKSIVSAGGGMDIRLSHSLVFRVFEVQISIAGARNGPQLSGSSSTGIAYSFGKR